MASYILGPYVTSHAWGHTITLIFCIVLLEAKVFEHDISGGEDQVQTGQPLAGAAEELPHVSPHLHSTVQYSTVQYSTVQYSSVQYSTVQNRDVTKLN